ncbi:MAG TPA: methylmalonyl-CoA mutase [Thermosulfidibacter takaii]|uniref:Methylmalonyl-CoA mutase n=1 Tax=Thermosulfidibacter takaii TaxID=412593 RepID=A0A7C0U5C2_9BACT|nr:methylmalonyl-CoA mutase [Thermosulfidibacter takaii]
MSIKTKEKTGLFSEEKLEEVVEAQREWEEGPLAKETSKHPERMPRFSTISDLEINRLYTPRDVPDFDYLRDLNFPSCYPFTRGVHTTMYRGRLWTMRQFAGFGTPEQTNERYRYLLSIGQTGLSMAFDFPTLYGRDSDDPMSRGEVGKCGVAVDTLKDFEIIFEGIPMDKITTSMTINPPAIVLLAMYIVAAERQGVSQDKIGGTVQNDMLKEFIAQKTWIYPPIPSLRLVRDIVVYCTHHVPRWNTISISGYHIREAGSTAVQELAFTLADGIEYVKMGIEAGLDVDAFAPRYSFFFDSHMDFFEEIAKMRAARRMWAKIMKERFRAKNPRSWWMRFHTQTAGCSLTAQQPLNNIVRTAIEALAAVLGGTQSLHTNSMDETWALPTEEAVTVALRTQQIIAYESGVANTIDPLGGSYFIEALTNEMEERAWEYINKIEEMGGIIPAIEVGYPQKEITEAAFRYQQQLESKEKIIVGVNEFIMPGEELPIEILKVDPEVERVQFERLNEVRKKRDNAKVKRMLQDLRDAAADEKENLMPIIIDLVREYASIGEIMGAMKDVFGEYRDPGYF